MGFHVSLGECMVTFIRLAKRGISRTRSAEVYVATKSHQPPSTLQGDVKP